jgi:hypothetical protein
MKISIREVWGIGGSGTDDAKSKTYKGMTIGDGQKMELALGGIGN